MLDNKSNQKSLTLFEHYSRKWRAYKARAESSRKFKRGSTPQMNVLDRGSEFRERNELNQMIDALNDHETPNNTFFNKLRDETGEQRKPAFNEVKTGSTRVRMCTYSFAKNPADFTQIRPSTALGTANRTRQKSGSKPSVIELLTKRLQQEKGPMAKMFCGSLH